MDNVPNKVIIIDSDTSMLSLLKTNLYALGIKNITSFTEAKFALNSLLVDDEIDLIILDWKLKDAKSITVFQILRSKPKYAFLPILITSGLLSKQDFSALNEFPCVEFLEKPFTKINLTVSIKTICKDQEWFQSNHTKINKMFSGLVKEGSNLATQYLDIIDSSRKPQALILAAARKLREQGQIDAASKLLIHGLNRIPNEPSLLGEMAKIHFINGDLISSRHAVERSLSYSPESIERLIFCGEVNLNLNDFEQARDQFEKVLHLDKDNELAQIGQKLAKNAKTDNISLAVSDGACPRNLAGLLNMIGITKIRSEKYEEGVKQYSMALGLVKESNDKQKVFFNLSLASLRAKSFDDAEKYLQEVINLGGPLAKRAEKHADKLDSYKTSFEKYSNAPKASESIGDNLDENIDEIFDDFNEEDFEDETFGASSNNKALDLSGLDEDVDLSPNPDKKAI